MSDKNHTIPSGVRGAVDLSGLANRAQQGAPASELGVPSGGTSSIVFEVDDASFAQVLELSRTIPVVLVIWASWDDGSKVFVNELSATVRKRNGKLVLGSVDAASSPQLVQALQIQASPSVIALIAGQPVPMFAGQQPTEVLDQLLDQLLELGKQHGVTGTVDTKGAEGGLESDQPAKDEPLPPLHQEAYEAIERGDYQAAANAYQTAIAQNPRDYDAVAGLAQANLLHRLKGKTASEIRELAAAKPKDVEAQLGVADLDVSGGRVADAFDRLLTLFSMLDQTGKTVVRERLVELFDVVGSADSRVIEARRRLANLLY